MTCNRSDASCRTRFPREAVRRSIPKSRLCNFDVTPTDSSGYLFAMFAIIVKPQQKYKTMNWSAERCRLIYNPRIRYSICVTKYVYGYVSRLNICITRAMRYLKKVLQGWHPSAPRNVRERSTRSVRPSKYPQFNRTRQCSAILPQKYKQSGHEIHGPTLGAILLFVRQLPLFSTFHSTNLWRGSKRGIWISSGTILPGWLRINWKTSRSLNETSVRRRGGKGAENNVVAGCAAGSSLFACPAESSAKGYFAMSTRDSGGTYRTNEQYRIIGSCGKCITSRPLWASLLRDRNTPGDAFLESRLS